jgi:hypothetical protein
MRFFHRIYIDNEKNGESWRGIWWCIHICRYPEDRVPPHTSSKLRQGVVRTSTEKPSCQFLALIVMSHWLGDVWIRIRDSFFVFLLPLFRSENRVYLSRGVQVVSAAWHAVMRTVAGVGDLVQGTRDGRTGQVLGGWAVERSGGVVCGLHLAGGD